MLCVGCIFIASLACGFAAVQFIVAEGMYVLAVSAPFPQIRHRFSFSEHGGQKSASA
jgi:hypothetical protein